MKKNKKKISCSHTRTRSSQDERVICREFDSNIKLVSWWVSDGTCSF